MTASNIYSPTVSVIIPTYNASRYIRAAISSVLASRGVTPEIIVVDDESTDDTWQILTEYGDSIVKLRQSKGGPYRARNLGAKVARGQWLAFLDADDEWEPDKLTRQLAVADDETALVYTDCRNIGDIERVKPLQSDNSELFEGRIFRELLQGNFISLSSVLICKQRFHQLQGFSLESTGVQDWELWLRVAGSGGIVRLCREPLTKYRHHAGQMSAHVDDRLQDRMGVLERALELPAAQDVSRRDVRKAYASVLQISAWRVAPVNPFIALKLYLKAASYWPFSTYTIRQAIKCSLGCLGVIHV